MDLVIKRTMAALACAAAFGAQSVAQAAVTVGSHNAANCLPVACFASEWTGGTVYQQIYSAAAFGGALNVDSITFFKDNGDAMDGASYDIAFYLTNRSVDGLSRTLSDNRGSLLANFGSFTLGGSMPDELTLNGLDFVYDPALGNLLMQITVTGVTELRGYSGFFKADSTGAVTRRVMAWNHTGENAAIRDRIGAITRFNAVSPAPEPATWAFMVMGFIGTGAAIRRRRTATASRAAARDVGGLGGTNASRTGC